VEHFCLEKRKKKEARSRREKEREIEGAGEKRGFSDKNPMHETKSLVEKRSGKQVSNQANTDQTDDERERE